jgi:hypothetical protein
MKRKLVVKGHSQDIALLRACYGRLKLDWLLEPWAEPCASAREGALGCEGSNRAQGCGRVIPYPHTRIS